MNLFRRFGHPMRGVTYGPEGVGSDPAAPPAGTPPPAPSAVVAPWAEAQNAPWTIGDRPWFDAIPEQPVRELISQKAYKTPAELAVAYHNANKLLSSDQRVAIPGETATPEDINNFYTKLGRPANAEAYEIKMPDGVQADPNMLNFAKTTAFDLGLNPKQTQQLADKWNTFAATQGTALATQQATENDAALTALEGVWKGKDELDRNKAAGQRVVQGLGLDEKLLASVEKNIGAAPLVELLARIGRASDEGKLTGGGTGGGDPNNPDSMTPEAAAAEISRLNSDAGFQAKYGDKMHGEHGQAVERMNKLFARAGTAYKL